MAAASLKPPASTKHWVQSMHDKQHWTPNESTAIPSLLLEWYDTNRRLLPWRGDNAPYGKKESQSQTQTTKAKCIPGHPASDSAAPAGRKGPMLSTEEMSSSGDDSSVVVISSSEDEDNVPSQTMAKNSIADVSFPPNKTRLAVSAYGTWVSEVMLQQTRVEAVIPHWLRWMERFPTCKSLAEASEEDVVSQWAGLGFYRRARQLRLGAQFVQRELGGQLPTEPAQLQRVPGIGPYTAGAIASIAHGQRAPIVDGNVVRVWSRMRALPVDAKAPATIKGCWPISRQIVPATRPGDFNQALMELGATVCMPKVARCAACPVAAHCAARKEALATAQPEAVLRYPLATKKQANKVMHGAAVAAVWLWGGGCSLLLQQRGEGGLLSGAWGPPVSLVPATGTSAAPSCAAVWQSTCSAVPGLRGDAVQLPQAAEAKHVFSGTTHIVQCTSAAISHTAPPLDPPAGFRWCAVAAPSDIRALGLTTWACKLLASALAQLPAAANSTWYGELAKRAKLKRAAPVGGHKRSADSSQQSLAAAWGAGGKSRTTQEPSAQQAPPLG